MYCIKYYENVLDSLLKQFCLLCTDTSGVNSATYAGITPSGGVNAATEEIF